MNFQDTQSNRLATALAACPSATRPSPARDALMLAIWSSVCTRSTRTVVPMGSKASVTISTEYATTEFLAVMTWLERHERQARALTPGQLAKAMRAVATLGMDGSARAARRDHLRGLTQVSPGFPVRWAEFDEAGARS